MKKLLYIMASLLVLFLSVVVPAKPAIAAITDSERNALIDLYNSTNGTGWVNNTNWLGALGTEDTWYGVTVEGEHVTEILLGGNNLVGQIPASIGDLTALRYLHLGSNKLTGAIPPEMGNLTSLQYLVLIVNQLTGAIPAELGNLTSLQSLDFDDNQLTGAIPAELGNLTNLLGLHLSQNHLTDTIPSTLGNLTNLQSLNLSLNQLSGTIPANLGNLPNLQQLYLYGNQLTGAIPPELGNLASLQYLILFNNQLTGAIPAELGNLTNLQYLYLDNNQLTGALPPELGNLTNLIGLLLNNNQLTGTIPADLGNLTSLHSLYLYSNQLTGSIPPELGNLTSLQYLNLNHNQLTGAIPTELGNLIDLRGLYLYYNRLTGPLPAELGNLASLTQLYLRGNQFAGSIPVELMNLTNLSNSSGIDFRYNALYTNNDTLRTFLNSKQLGGNWEGTQTIAPTNLAAGTPTETSIRLTWTAIAFTGGTGGYEVYYATISGGPYTLFGITANKSVVSSTVTDLTPGTTYFFRLRTVTNPHAENQNTVYSEYTAEVSGNTSTHSGAIPESERNALIDLYNSTNGAEWLNKTNWLGEPGTEGTWYGVTVEASHVTRIVLGTNNLIGQIPASIGNLTSLWDLNLHNNQLSGTLPAEIGNLASLTHLRLDDNHLTAIPPELGNLTSLLNLDLDNNQLTDIPPELGNITSLAWLGLGRNQITHIPPELGNLSNLTHLYLIRNQLTAIPPELGNLTSLIDLRLHDNQLTAIPSELGNLTNLNYLYLNNNQLITIPPELADLSALRNLILNFNRLTGTLPAWLGNLANLQYLEMSNNQLTGAIPSWLGNLTNLNGLLLNNNQLTGTIPADLGDLTSLRFLYLNDNQLTGSIPPELGNLTNLQYLILNGNQLTGPIPLQLTNLTNLYDGSSDFRWNALYTDNDALRTFLNGKQAGGAWESTQTIAPTNLAAGVPAETSIALTWAPIAYTGDTGGYEVYYATTSSGPYTLFGTTSDKSVVTSNVTGLTAGTTYFFRLRAVTNPHARNLNTVYSEYSAEVSATTAATPKPDLVISEKYEEWIDPEAKEYKVFFTIQNVGDIPAPAGHDVLLQVNGNNTEQVEVPIALGTGESWSSSFNATMTLTQDSDNVIIRADANNEVDEAIEWNNVRYNWFSYPPKPELTVWKWDEWVEQGQTYKVHYTINNQGNAPVLPGYDVQLTVDGTIIETQEVTVTLAAGQSYNSTFDTSCNLTGGVDSITVRVDVYNEVDEAIENGANSEFNTLSWPPKPDLVIRWKYEGWVEGQQQYVVNYCVRNIGNEKALAGHTIQLMVDDIVIENGTVPVDLWPGQEYWYTSSSINLTDGTDNISVTADINNNVDESDESNNRLNNVWPPWPVVNNVTVLFHTVPYYLVSGDNFTNCEVTGTMFWDTPFYNAPDETGLPVVDARLALSSNLTLNWFSPVPTTMEPPLYEWSIGDIAEGSLPIIWLGSNPSPQVTFTPGYDISRSVDRTVFNEMSLQTVTVTVTPRVDMIGTTLYVGAFTYVGESVNATIVSPSPGTSGVQFVPGPDGSVAVLIAITDPEKDVSYTKELVFEVTPKVPEVEYMPRVQANWVRRVVPNTTTNGSSFSCAVEGIGTWTASANGTYQWTYVQDLHTCVDLNGSHSSFGTDLIIAEKHEEWVNEQAKQYKVFFTIKNSGILPAPAGHHVLLQVNGNDIEQVKVPVILQPGESWSSSFTATMTLTQNSDNIMVCADANNEVDEANETNNSFTNLFTLLELTSTVEPAAVPAGLPDIPLQDIPLQDIPLQDIPLQDIPLQDISFQGTPLQDIPLQDITLLNITWEQKLAGTSLEGIPLQDITLEDLRLAGIPLQDITLADILLGTLPLQDILVDGVPLQDILLSGIPLQDIPLQDIPLQDVNLAGTPLQDIPLQDIPLQDISWAMLLRGTPLQDIPLQDITLVDLMLGGIPLQDIPLQDIPLQDISLLRSRLIGTPLQDIPLQDITLADIVLARIPLQDILLLTTTLDQIPLQDITWQAILQGTPLQDIPLQDITLRELLLASSPLQDISWSPTPLQDIPLQDIPLQDIPLQDITIWGTLLAGTPLQDIPLQDITLGDLLLAGIPLQDIPLQDIPLQDIKIGGIPLQDIPLQDIPIVGTPLQDIPLQDIPLQDITLLNIVLGTPLQDIPLQDITLKDLLLAGVPLRVPAPQSTSLQDIPLQDIPLQDITWQALLMGTPLQDIPLQDIRLWDLALASISLRDIPLQDIPLQDIPLQDITWESVLVGTPLQDIPLQDITLGDLALAAAPLQDITLNGIPLQDIPLQDIPLHDVLLGIPLQDIPLQDIKIRGVPLQDIPLQDIPLQDITWQAILLGTPLQDIPLQDITLGMLLLNNVPLQDITLLDIVLGQVPLQDIVFGQLPLQDITLLDVLLGRVPLQDITLWQLLLAFIPLQDISWESVPLQDIPLGGIYGVTYTDVLKNSGQTTAEDVTITHVLPDGFTYVPGSATVTLAPIGSSSLGTGAPLPDPAIDGQSLIFGTFALPGTTISASGTALIIRFDAVSMTTLGEHVTGSISANGSNFGTIGPVMSEPVSVIDALAGNTSPAAAVEIDKDHLYFSYISNETDMDWFKIPVPAKGSLVTVYLSHLPVDYDLVLCAAENLPEGTPIPLQDIPLQDIPLQDIPLQDIPLQDVPLQDIPLQDIALQDLPLQDIPLQDIPLQDVSIERGTIDEMAGDKVVNETGFYYIRVNGYNGAWSNEPYILRVKIRPPLPLALHSRDMVPTVIEGVSYEPNRPIETIFVTNMKRMAQYYGADNATSLQVRLQAFVERPDVNGMILAIETDPAVAQAYDAWDTNNTGDPEIANLVTSVIKSMLYTVINRHSEVKYVVIVGDDEIIPFRRVPDETCLSNESDYASQAHLQKTSALYASLLHGYILTDDYYVDMAPIGWMGRELYVPDYAIGRLIETPDDIMGMLNKFESNNGMLVINHALVTGYDFLSDGAQAIVEALKNKGITVDDSLINDIWTKVNLEYLLSNPSTAPDLASINAHFSHFALGPATGDPLYSNQMNVAYIGGKLVFSLGCHSGLSVDNSVTEADDPQKEGDWTLDLPQLFSRNATWYIGNTGYGYGDTNVVALSEELMLRFAQELSTVESPSVAVGQALLNAKHGYYLSMGSYGPFDEKTMIESTLYGLPMYQIDPDTPALKAPTEPANLVVTINQVTADNLPIGQIQQQVLLTEKATANGQIYLADNETAFVPYRPIQPQKTIWIAVDGQVAHGALFTGGTYQDIPDFNPVIGRPIWDLSTYEPQFINGAWYPSKLQTIMSLRTPQGLKQTLVVVPGQFITTFADTEVRGTERLYGSLDYTVYYSSSSDYTKPDISRIDITPAGDINVVVVDDGQVNRVVVTWTAGTGDNQWRTFDLTRDPTSGTWTGTFPVPPTGGLVDFMVQAVDDAGNVGTNPSRGIFNPGVIIMETGVNQTAYEGETVYFQGAIVGPVQVQRIEWDFGDGSSASDTLTPNHRYSSDGQYIVTFTVTDTSGAIFTDVFIVTVKNKAPIVSPISTPVTPIQVAQLVNTSATFKDMGVLDVHTAVWNWGDGVSSEAEIIERNGAGSATGKHVYNSTGVYTVTLTVTDDGGLTGSCQAIVIVVDTTPPDVSISSPEDGKTFINTQGKIAIEYTVEDVGDPAPDIVVTLDGEIFTNDNISLDDVALGEHKLVVSATDESGNKGEASATFYVEPQALEVFTINHMIINWAPKSSYPGNGSSDAKFDWSWYHTLQKDDKFSISGWIQLPEGYTQGDLDASATITIAIANGLGEGYDTLVFKKQPLGRLGTMWMYWGYGNPPGAGIDITWMTIWFSSPNSEYTGWAWFNISGVLELPNINKNTEPANATVTIELPITTEAGGGSLAGKETVAFRVFKNLDLWSYLVQSEPPNFWYPNK